MKFLAAVLCLALPILASANTFTVNDNFLGHGTWDTLGATDMGGEECFAWPFTLPQDAFAQPMLASGQNPDGSPWTRIEILHTDSLDFDGINLDYLLDIRAGSGVEVIMTYKSPFSFGSPGTPGPVGLFDTQILVSGPSLTTLDLFPTQQAPGDFQGFGDLEYLLSELTILSNATVPEQPSRATTAAFAGVVALCLLVSARRKPRAQL